MSTIREDLAWCERVGAIRNTWHLRVLDADRKLYLGGGITSRPLGDCWPGNGWDIDVPVDLEAAATAVREGARGNDGALDFCPRCVEAALAAPETPKGDEA